MLMHCRLKKTHTHTHTRTRTRTRTRTHTHTHTHSQQFHVITTKTTTVYVILQLYPVEADLNFGIQGGLVTSHSDCLHHHTPYGWLYVCMHTSLTYILLNYNVTVHMIGCLHISLNDIKLLIKININPLHSIISHKKRIRIIVSEHFNTSY